MKVPNSTRPTQYPSPCMSYLHVYNMSFLFTLKLFTTGMLVYLNLRRCPYCKTSNYAVEYRGVKSKEEKSLEQIVRLDNVMFGIVIYWN